MSKSYSKLTFIIAAFCLWLVACAPIIDGDSDNGGEAAPIDSDAVITLERTACFGTCPIYQVTIYGDGRVVYDGREFVEVLGKQTYQIDPAEVQELINFIVDGGYQELDDNYTDRLITDMPSIITSLTINGATKRIDHYLGNDSTPLFLVQIENRIDMLAQSNQWTGADLDDVIDYTIFGQLFVRDMDGEIELPEGTVVTTRIEDVSNPDDPSLVAVEILHGDMLRLPLPYELVVDLNVLDLHGGYKVSAEIAADGGVIYQSVGSFDVLNHTMDNVVDIELAPAQ